MDGLSSEPTPRERELSQGFMRQRRNLILASLILVLFYAGELTVERLNIFGSILQIGEPSAVAIGVWLVFAYAGLRFFQYYLEEGPASKTFPVMLERAAQEEIGVLERRAQRSAHMISDRTLYFEPALKPGSPAPLRWTRNTRVERKRSLVIREVKMGLIVADPEYEKQFSDKEMTADLPPEAEVAALTEKWEPEKFKGVSDRQGASFTAWIRISVLERFWCRVRGAIKFLFGRSYFTDYQLPLVFAFLAFAVALYWVATK